MEKLDMLVPAHECFIAFAERNRVRRWELCTPRCGDTGMNSLQIHNKLSAGLIALFPLLLEAAGDNGSEIVRYAGIKLQKRLRLIMNDRVEGCHLVLGGKRKRTGEHLVEEDAEG